MIENSSSPLSVTINNVTITILNITQNKKFDCKQCYNFIHKESCDYRKDCNIAPSKMLCGTEVEIVVSNMSNSSFGISCALYLPASIRMRRHMLILSHINKEVYLFYFPILCDVRSGTSSDYY